MKQSNPPTGARPGFLAAVLCIAAVLLGAMWFFRPKSSPPAQAESPPPASETTVVESAPPPPLYAQVRHRDFSKRRGAPRRRQAQAASSITNQPALTVEAQWGIRLCGMRLSMGDSFVDLRYTVLDPAKAARLGDGKTSACILDCVSGARLPMRRPPAEGAFPPTGNRLATGRMYFAVVPNLGGAIKSGSKVALLVGSATATNLVVQ